MIEKSLNSAPDKESKQSQIAGLKALLVSKAKMVGGDWVLASAIIEVESSWRPDLVRYEPAFEWICDPQSFAPKLGITVNTETCLQRFSFGLGQIMGGTVRSLGYSGSLFALVEPDLNIEWMFKILGRISRKYEVLTDKIAAYNAGTARTVPPSTEYVNQKYVDKVMAAMQKYL